MEIDPEEKLICDLQAWVHGKYGRAALLARKLGVSKQLVSNWITRRRTPTLHDALAIQAFLKREALRLKAQKKRTLS
jgi:transcriptional regulator with XRE-family HTH domain